MKLLPKVSLFRVAYERKRSLFRVVPRGNALTGSNMAAANDSTIAIVAIGSVIAYCFPLTNLLQTIVQQLSIINTISTLSHDKNVATTPATDLPRCHMINTRVVSSSSPV